MKFSSLNRKSQAMSMPFTMIFSLIVIAFIIYVGFITIKGFLENTDRIKVADFATSFKYDVNTLWQATAGSKAYSYNLPSKITQICFASSARAYNTSQNNSQIVFDIKKLSNYQNSNLFLYPLSVPIAMGIPASFKIDCGETTKVDCLDLSSIPNPYCIPTDKGSFKISLEKSGRVVKVVK